MIDIIFDYVMHNVTFTFMIVVVILGTAGNIYDTVEKKGFNEEVFYYSAVGVFIIGFIRFVMKLF